MERPEDFGLKDVIRVILRGHGYSLTFDPELSQYGNFKHLLKTTRPIVTKFHIESPGVEETNICSNRAGHLSNMTTTPIYGKKTLKIFFRTN